MEWVADLNSQLVIARSDIAQANTRLDRINSVHKDIVENAFVLVRANLLCVVLNTVDMNVFDCYASHRESYYCNKQYARYGYTE
jgi:hypothetical protein